MFVKVFLCAIPNSLIVAISLLEVLGQRYGILIANGSFRIILISTWTLMWLRFVRLMNSLPWLLYELIGLKVIWAAVFRSDTWLWKAVSISDLRMNRYLAFSLLFNPFEEAVSFKVGTSLWSRCIVINVSRSVLCYNLSMWLTVNALWIERLPVTSRKTETFWNSSSSTLTFEV